MSNYTELNLEEGMPTSIEALKILKSQIEIYRSEKKKCVLIIHGYGSSGKGGKIRSTIRKWLTAQKENRTIKTLVFGERFDIFNEDARVLKDKYKELTSLLNQHNEGITIIEL